MHAAKLTKLDMAKRMATSRSQLDRVLDPSNVSVQLDTLIKDARAVGKGRGDQDQTRHQEAGGVSDTRCSRSGENRVIRSGSVALRKNLVRQGLIEH